LVLGFVRSLITTTTDYNHWELLLLSTGSSLNQLQLLVNSFWTVLQLLLISLLCGLSLTAVRAPSALSALRFVTQHPSELQLISLSPGPTPKEAHVTVDIASTGRTLQRKSTLDFVTLDTVAESYLGYVFMSRLLRKCHNLKLCTQQYCGLGEPRKCEG
jgi:hypothetical protein